MLVFNAKILGTNRGDREDGVGTKSQTQKFALKTLSKQEKLILVELQRTRREIVNELGKINPATCSTSENWFEVKKTIGEYQTKLFNESNISSSSAWNDKAKHILSINKVSNKTQRPKSTTNIFDSTSPTRSLHKNLKSTGNLALKPFQKNNQELQMNMKYSGFKTGIDLLPIMATNGDTALEVGLKKQGTLKLPIFKLPSIDYIDYKQRDGYAGYVKNNILDNSESLIDHNGKYINRFQFITAVAIMYKKIPEEEVSYIKKHLKVTDQNLVNVEIDIKLQILINESNAILQNEQCVGLQDIQIKNGPIVFVEKSVSVFMRAAHIAYINSTGNLNDSYSPTSNHSLNKSNAIDHPKSTNHYVQGKRSLINKISVLPDQFHQQSQNSLSKSIPIFRKDDHEITVRNNSKLPKKNSSMNMNRISKNGTITSKPKMNAWGPIAAIVEVILPSGCSVISVAFYYLCG
jgi:hypothetical protein